MKKLLTLILFIVLLALPVMVEAGTAYYCDCTVNSGTGGVGTFADPFESINDANDGPAGGWQTGDDLYFLDNSTCQDSEYLNVNWDGASGDRIIIGAYQAEGNFTYATARPILDGNSWTVPTPASTDGMIEMDSSTLSGYITIQDIRVNDSGQYGIYTNLVDNVIVDNCYVYRARKNGIILVRCNTGTVSDNIVEQASYLTTPAAGITINGGDVADESVDIIVTRNTVFHCYEGIGIYKRSRNCIIEKNEVYDNRSYQIYIASSAYNTIRHNLVYGSVDGDTWSTAVGAPSNAIFLNVESWKSYVYGGYNEIYGNLIAWCQKGITLADGHVDFAQTYNKIYNNTIVDCAYSFYFGDNSGWVGNEIKNNTSWLITGGGVVADDVSRTGVTWSHNLYEADPGGNANDNAVIDASPNLTKTSGWRSLVAGSETGTNFYPQAGAPNIDVGTFLSGYEAGVKDTGTDFTARPITVVTASQVDAAYTPTDIGAHVYVTGDPPAEGSFADITFWCRAEENPMEADNGDYPDAVNLTFSGAALDASAKKYGSLGVLCSSNGAPEYVQAPVAGNNLVSDERSRVGFWFYVDTWLTGVGLLRVHHDASKGNNQINVKLDGTEEIKVVWIDNGSTRIDSASTTADLVDDTWYFLEAAWDTTANVFKVNIDGSEVFTSSASISPLATDPDILRFGNTYTLGSAYAVWIDNMMVSDEYLSANRDFYTDTHEGTALKDLTAYPTASSPILTPNIGIVTDPLGTPSYNADQTISYSTDGTLFYVGLPASEQLTISDPNLSTLTTAPIYGTAVGRAIGQVLISSVYYLCYEFKAGYTWNYTYQRWDSATGHRGTNLQTAAVGSALALNGTTMQDGDSNNLTTTLPSADIGVVTLSNPKTANEPWEIKPSGGDATTLANLETAVGASGLFTTDVVILSSVTEATATATAAALYYIYSLTGDFDCDSLACTVRGTNRVSGSVLNSGNATLHAYNPPRVSN